MQKTIKQEIKTIFFDVGGVLLSGGLEDIIQEATRQLGLDQEQFFSFFKTHTKNLATGKMKMAELGKRAQETFHFQADFVDTWLASHRQVEKTNQLLLTVARKLKRTYTVGIISNVEDISAKLDRESGVYNFFSPIIFSCECGLEKPMPEIYQLALSQVGGQAEECLMIDDREKNLIPAKELGMQTILFQNNEQLLQEMKLLNIEVKM
jgi:putative hydrolase of the HAD superfamily